MMHRIFFPTTVWTVISFLFCLLLSDAASAQGVKPAPDRKENEGQGPFETLVIRGAIVIDGTGAPPYGPVNIVIKGNRIESIGRGVGRREADHVVDASGMYVMPGFVDMHAHSGDRNKAPETEYVYKLWMAHGVTTVRGVPLGANDWTVREKERSERNEIVAPRIFNYQRPPRSLQTPEQAREWVREAPLRGIDGLKLGAYRPEIMAALLDEAKRLGLGSTAHLGQTGVAQMNAIDAARLGLGTVTHFYGHFEALLKDHVVQPWPVDHNHNNEQHRFGQVARLWDKIHPPGSPQWKAYLREHLELGTVFDPTMTIYSAGRDVMRARTAEWHDRYTLPSLRQFFEPSARNHGSYWHYWTTADEVAWRNFYRVWMQLINDYKKMGGRVTCGADSGFIYDTYGFGFVEELELLQEAGFHPLEVIQSATMNGALTLFEPKGERIPFGVVRPGLLADLVIIEENPLENLKVLYGTGAVKLNKESGEVERVGGVRWTVKDGIVYDAKQLLADVAAMVQAQKDRLAGSDEPASPSDKPANSEKDPEPEDPAEVQPTTAQLPHASTTAQLIQGESILIAVSANRDTVWGYSKQEGRWQSQSLGQASEAPLEPVVSDHVGYVRLGQQVFAFSAMTGSWATVELQGLDRKPESITISRDLITIQLDNQITVFGARSGQWQSIDLTSDQLR